ncbi:MAG: alpha/beta fold hydrolase [Nocardioides sp.]
MRREFTALTSAEDPRMSRLSVPSQAALRQFGVDRLTGYGVDRSDALELRERVLLGEDWMQAASDLADSCSGRADEAPQVGGGPTRALYLRRASALLRMAQVMMLIDTPERCSLYARAGELYGQAAELTGDRIRVELDVPGEGGPLIGWMIPAAGAVVGSVVMIGGIEGYAMDFDEMGRTLAARGADVLLLDGPGQGETRFVSGRYLDPGWRDAFRVAIDYLEERAPARPIGLVGNSMGGSLAMAIAATDPRVAACCSNGGLPAPWLVSPEVGIFFAKMASFCGTDDADRAIQTWSTVNPLSAGSNRDHALLVLHGDHDPMISSEKSGALLDGASAGDRHMVVFSDGIHCLYNHQQDRDALIADWLGAQLRRRLDTTEK